MFLRVPNLFSITPLWETLLFAASSASFPRKPLSVSIPIAHLSRSVLPSALSENVSCAPSSTKASIFPSGDFAEYTAATAEEAANTAPVTIDRHINLLMGIFLPQPVPHGKQNIRKFTGQFSNLRKNRFQVHKKRLPRFSEAISKRRCGDYLSSLILMFRHNTLHFLPV